MTRIFSRSLCRIASLTFPGRGGILSQGRMSGFTAVTFHFRRESSIVGSFRILRGVVRQKQLLPLGLVCSNGKQRLKNVAGGSPTTWRHSSRRVPPGAAPSGNFDRPISSMRLALDAGVAPKRFALGAVAAVKYLEPQRPSAAELNEISGNRRSGSENGIADLHQNTPISRLARHVRSVAARETILHFKIFRLTG